MRHSYQRDAVLHSVQAGHDHPTAGQVFDQVREKMPAISLGTVYRNLKQLADARIIRRLTAGGSVHYDGNLDRHDHFRCVRCRRLRDIQLPAEFWNQRLGPLCGFTVTGYELVLTGVCDDCRPEAPPHAHANE